MAAAKRNVNYYELFHSFDSRHTTRDILIHCFQKAQELLKVSPKKLDYSSGLNDTFHIRVGNQRDITLKTLKLYGLAKVSKKDQFNDTWDPDTQVVKSLGDGAGDNEGVLEETHFVIDFRFSKPLIAIETTQSGIKIGSLLSYLNWWGRKNTKNENLHFGCLPIMGRSSDEFLEAVKEIATFQIKVKRQNIPYIKNSDEQLGTMLENAQNYAPTDYIDLVLGFDFRVKESLKPDTNILKSLVKKFMNKQAQGPYFDNFEALTIRAKEDDEPLKPFDLIQERTASQIYVNRRNKKSKYFNSSEFYDEIDREIGKNFSTYPKSEGEDAKPLLV